MVNGTSPSKKARCAGRNDVEEELIGQFDPPGHEFHSGVVRNAAQPLGGRGRVARDRLKRLHAKDTSDGRM